MTFGAHGFFGYGPCSLTAAANKADRIPSPDAPISEAVWWSTYQVDTLPSGTNIDPTAIKAQLQERHSHWKDPVIREIVSTATVTTIYPTWTTPPLPTWTNQHLVLVGDAAHALQPSSGQGASQALEDAQVLAMLLAHFLHTTPPPSSSSSPANNAIPLALKKYVDIRKPRVDAIQEKSKQFGDMKRKKGVVEEWVMYFFVWLMGRWPWVSGYESMLKERPVDHVQRFIEAW